MNTDPLITTERVQYSSFHSLIGGDYSLQSQKKIKKYTLEKTHYSLGAAQKNNGNRQTGGRM